MSYLLFNQKLLLSTHQIPLVLLKSYILLAIVKSYCVLIKHCIPAHHSHTHFIHSPSLFFPSLLLSSHLLLRHQPQLLNLFLWTASLSVQQQIFITEEVNHHQTALLPLSLESIRVNAFSGINQGPANLRQPIGENNIPWWHVWALRWKSWIDSSAGIDEYQTEQTPVPSPLLHLNGARASLQRMGGIDMPADSSSLAPIVL